MQVAVTEKTLMEDKAAKLRGLIKANPEKLEELPEIAEVNRGIGTGR